MSELTFAIDATELLRVVGRRMDESMRAFLSQRSGAPKRLMESIEYSLLAGGKRLRPALVLACHDACGGADETSALAAAGAIELIHTFSLVHDDLPAMDDDDLRRGRPTNHKVFGEATAILAGDAMTTLAFELLATEAAAEVLPNLVTELARASGPAGMIGGQVLDIDGENRSLDIAELMQIHRMKTGALLTCAARMGAIVARADAAKLDAATRFGQHLGLAFQIIDDLLDVTATPEHLGKATNKDARRGKNTYPTLLGIEESKRRADEQLGLAMQAIEILPHAALLRGLARFVIERTK